MVTFARIFTYFTALLTFGGLIFALFAQDILIIMTTESYWEAYKGTFVVFDENEKTWKIRAIF